MESEGREIYNTDKSVPDRAEETAGELDSVMQQKINILNDPIVNANAILLKAGLPDIDWYFYYNKIKGELYSSV